MEGLERLIPDPEPARPEIPEGTPCVVHLFGHVRIAGFVRQVEITGAGFLRIDVPEVRGSGRTSEDPMFIAPAVTCYRSPGSIYGIDPVSEDVVRKLAVTLRPVPAAAWDFREAEELAGKVREPQPPGQEPPTPSRPRDRYDDSDDDFDATGEDDEDLDF